MSTTTAPPATAKEAPRHPPKPRLVLHVGVTGHRPPKLPHGQFATVKETVRGILCEIQTILAQIVEESRQRFSVEPPRIRVISSLAEGADRLIATTALELGLEIQCPLPFFQDDYQRDFESCESREEYQRLLNCATAVLELDGDRADEGSAYWNAGAVMLEQSDVIIAVWNGGKAAGRDGTAEIVAEARRRGIPVLHISPDNPSAIRLLGEETSAPWLKFLRPKIGKMVAVDAGEAMRAKRYFSEKEQRLNYGWLFTFFRNLVCGRNLRGIPLRLPRYLESTAAQWEKTWQEHSTLPDPIRVKLNAAFLDHYAWTDNLAVFYAGLFRSAYLVRYLFGFIATFFLAVGFYTPVSFGWLGFTLQLSSLAVVIGLVRLENGKQWHLRFLEYRMLAERLRVLRFLFPLGCGLKCIAKPHGGLSEVPPWVAGHLRAIVRGAGLVTATVNQGYLNAHRECLQETEVAEQSDYHSGAAKWQTVMASRLYTGAILFFVLGLMVYMARAWAYKNVPGIESVKWNDPTWRMQFWYWIKVNTIVFPAIGATLAGIRSHGEFKRLAASSRAMEAFLKEKAETLELTNETDWKTASRITQEIADSMLGETTEWRTTMEGKGLSLPV